jgi:hypothetical protein
MIRGGIGHIGHDGRTDIRKNLETYYTLHKHRLDETGAGFMLPRN